MLNVVALSEAQNLIKKKMCTYVAESETVPLDEALGRVLYSDVVACENIPPFDRSTVDGFAVISRDTYGSAESVPSQLEISAEVLMGEKTDVSLKTGECVKISTGGMLPQNADSVVMVEHTETGFDGYCLVYKAVSPYENVTRKGDDILEGETVLRKGTLISCEHVGVLACLGITSVKVVKKLRVGIISTGDELVSADEIPPSGKIRDVNSHILTALMKKHGAEINFYGIVSDDFASIYKAVEAAASENDIVLISGGSSAGVKDMTVRVISQLGQVHFHGIALKPGKPTIFGTVDGKAVFGLPGNPGAAFYVALLTVVPLIRLICSTESKEYTVSCKISQNISSNHGREEIISVKIINGTAIPVFSKSAFVSVLCDCDGYIVIQRDAEGLKTGDRVEVHLF